MLPRRLFTTLNVTGYLYEMTANEVHTFPYQGPPTSIASFLISGRRQAVTNDLNGDRYLDGTWHLENPVRLYVKRYTAGQHTIQAGPDGLVYLCFIRVMEKDPVFEHVVVDGSFVVPADAECLVVSEAIDDHAQFSSIAIDGFSRTITGTGDVLLVRPVS